MGSETLFHDFAGHRLAYRVAGSGPAVVVLSQYWRGEPIQAQLLRDRCQVFQITPVGYGQSDRVPGLAGEALGAQVLAVLDHHKADRFVVWGYSAGGAMAAAVARATPRAAGLICGGFPLFTPLTEGAMRQLDRRLHPDHASRSLWPWINTFDWRREVERMSCPCLFYWGSDDRQAARKLRRSQSERFRHEVDFVEIPGRDHATCGSAEDLQAYVVPKVNDWIRLGLNGAPTACP